MSIKIEEGRRGVLRNGKTVGPLVRIREEEGFHSDWVWRNPGECGRFFWTAEGKVGTDTDDWDIVNVVPLCYLGAHQRGKDDNCTICGATPEQVNEQARTAWLPEWNLRPPGLRIYLSGPMTGYPNFNYPLFNVVSGMLRKAGHTVYNPAEFQHDEPEFPPRKAFSAYAKFICEEADAIVLLPSWGQSLGVSAELALAKNCKLRVIELKDLNLLISA